MYIIYIYIHTVQPQVYIYIYISCVCFLGTPGLRSGEVYIHGGHCGEMMNPIGWAWRKVLRIDDIVTSTDRTVRKSRFQ